MILQCPSCDTKYNFPDDKFSAGRKVKCTICGNVFQLEPPAATPPEPEEPEDFLGGDQTDFGGEEEPFDAGLGDESLDSLFDDDGDSPEEDDMDSFSLEETPVPAAPPEPEPQEPPADDSFADALEEEQESGSRVREEFSLGDEKGKGKSGKKIDLDALVGTDSGKKKRSLLPIIMGAVLLLLAGAGAWYFFMSGDDTVAPESQETAQTDEVITTEQIKNFSLEDVKQYYVDNDKVGKIFVVQGKVVNNFSSPKELITIEANLFDAGGVSVKDKQILAGNSVSLYQLQMLTEEELESAINNKVGILTANTNVPPGGEVPFVVTFYNPPETVQEFGIKVVSAKNPPKE